MDTHVTTTVTHAYDPVMPTRRRYVSTMTEEARAAIPPLVEAEKTARAAHEAALKARNEAIRDQYRKGVDPRDLVEATRHGDSEPLTREHIQRIVKGVMREE
jgi:hypothetical protein